MKKILLLLLAIVPLFVLSQSVGYLRYDTVKIMKSGGFSNLVLLDATKDSTGGVGYNAGGGLFRFKRSRMLNDTTFTIGLDTITIRAAGTGGGGGSASLTNTRIGYGAAGVLKPTGDADFFFTEASNTLSVPTVQLGTTSATVAPINFGAFSSTLPSSPAAGMQVYRLTDSAILLRTNANDAWLPIKYTRDLVLRNNLTFTQGSGLGPDTLDASGGGSVAETDQQVVVGTGTGVDSYNGLTWNNSAKRLSVLNTSTYTLSWLNDATIHMRGGILQIGDTTLGNPVFLEILNPYGGATGRPIRFTSGWMGSEEYNIWGWNFHYRGQVHNRYMDPEYANWAAVNGDYFVIQAQGKYSAWNSDTGSKVIFRVDYLKSGTKYVGSRLTTNELDVRQTNSTYQNQDSYAFKIRTASATATFSGVQAINIVDSVQLQVGADASTGYIATFEKTGAATVLKFTNDESGAAPVQFDIYRRNVASFGGANNNVVGRFNYNSLNYEEVIQNNTTISAGAFRLMDWRWLSTNAAGTQAERMRLESEGSLLLGTATALPSSLLTLSSTTRGVVLPRMTSTQRTSISSPATAVIVFDTDSAKYFFYSGSAWVAMSGTGGGGSSLDWDGVLALGGTQSQYRAWAMGGNAFTFNGGIVRVKSATDSLTIDPSAGAVNFKTNAAFTFDKNVSINTASSPTFRLTDAASSSYAELNVASTVANFQGTASRFKFAKPVVTTDNSNYDANYGFNGGAIRVISTNPNSLSEPNIIWNNSGTGAQFTVYANPIANSFMIANNGRAIFGNTTSEDGSTRRVQVHNGISLSDVWGTTPINILGRLADSSVTSIISIPATLGGTAQTSWTTGDLLYASGSNTLAKRAIGTSLQVLSVSGGLPTWTATPATDEGTYSPTITAVGNVTGSPTATTCYYSVIGNTVTVWGEITIDPTTTLTLTTVAISLPTAWVSAISNTYDLSGSATTETLNETMRIKGDATNDRAIVVFTPVDVASRTASFKFTYHYSAP